MVVLSFDDGSGDASCKAMLEATWLLTSESFSASKLKSGLIMFVWDTEFKKLVSFYVNNQKMKNSQIVIKLPIHLQESFMISHVKTMKEIEVKKKLNRNYTNLY